MSKTMLLPLCGGQNVQGVGSVRLKSLLLAATSCASALILAAPVQAQESQLSEIIVTARKRQESILNVPVVETAVSGAQLERLRVTDLKDVATLVPGLSFGESLLSSGTQVSIRGVGTTAVDPGVDQSVSLAIDGLQLSQGLAYSSGMFDLGLVEVLRGPQALFYGKSSPGGVISLRTADPTDKFEVIARAGYEFEADEKSADLIVSGPVTDTLKLRFAGRYSDSDGYFHNPALGQPGTGAKDPETNRIAPSKDWILRGTALWSPTRNFDARLKVNYASNRSLYAGTPQYVSCPDGLGSPSGRLFLGGGEDCRLDRTMRIVSMDPAAFPGISNGGVQFQDMIQRYGTLELNYRPIADLTLTSVTGYYNNRSKSLINTGETTYAGTALAVENKFRRRDFTQELRANSEFSGPVNFTLGGFYQDAMVANLATQRGNILYPNPFGGSPNLPAVRAVGQHNLGIDTYSVFGQVRWQVIPRLELAAGARWTDEKRRDKPVNLISGSPVPVPLATPELHSSNISPELTATYRPTDTLTVYGSLKKGYKSGSFNITTGATPGQNNAFGDEQVQGGEVGLKTRLLDRRLALDIAAYDYKYKGLQVGAIVPGTNLTPVSRTVNAGRSEVYGIDFDAAYRPPQIEGLGLHVGVNWNHSRFNELNNAPCWGGQTIAEGCNQFLNPATGRFTAQDLTGSPLIRAPRWQGNFGFDYETSIGHDLTLVLTNSNQFSSKYLTGLSGRQDAYQDGFLKMDVSVALKGPSDRWEVSVTGRNLNDKLTSGTCFPANFANGLLYGGQVTGGTTRGSAGVDELACLVDRGREVWLTLTLRPFN